MDWNTQTIKTYDESAKELAEYFKGIGARVSDIELGLKLANANSEAKVVEVGCGDGRDAEEIVKRVAWYEGYDPSEGLLDIARKRLPDASFVTADALTYQYPENLDVVYAFASLLHVNQGDMKVALTKIAAALRKDGIAFISLKERPTYEEEVKEDQYGKRMFYYYNARLIQELAGHAFIVAHEDHQTIGRTDWFTLALKKV
ncbi:MAG TPA: class I SAM-dependent methyltransferase [Candidatus Saccharimonadales bacterium]